jgi:hypothetical protein
MIYYIAAIIALALLVRIPAPRALKRWKAIRTADGWACVSYYDGTRSRSLDLAAVSVLLFLACMAAMLAVAVLV